MSVQSYSNPLIDKSKFSLGFCLSGIKCQLIAVILVIYYSYRNLAKQLCIGLGHQERAKQLDHAKLETKRESMEYKYLDKEHADVWLCAQIQDLCYETDTLIDSVLYQVGLNAFELFFKFDFNIQ